QKSQIVILNPPSSVSLSITWRFVPQTPHACSVSLFKNGSNSASECCPSRLANSTRSLLRTRDTSKVRSTGSLPGINSARKVNHMPGTSCLSAGRFFLPRGFLLISVNKSAHSIGEQHVHFVWFYNGRDFAFAEHGMLQRLSLTVRTRSIIWGTCVVRVSTY